MKTVKLITCNDSAQAHILQGALENEGIESLLHNENFSDLYKGLMNNISGVDIFVAETDYDAAVRVLKENECWPEELTLCPYCGSPDIKMALKKGRSRLRAMGAAILTVLTMTPPGNNHWEYVCKHCHKTFVTPVAQFPPQKKEEEEK